ncbi:heparin lyase I family protein [Prosthecobacter sp.]|uniref:heparin lyase I family protein n=1 Tax=Prosthecobacter sp. TaxID=1965333 RepID=UPI003782DA7E
MKIKRLLLSLAVLAFIALGVLIAVRLDWFAEYPVRDEKPFTFHDDFEGAATFLDLYPKDLSRWHGRQLVPEQNTIDISREQAHSGQQSVKCFASVKRNDVTSKSDVEREQLHFVKGDHVWSEAWFWLKAGAGSEHVFLWDLETTRKWQSPGRRVYLQKGDIIASDLGKWFSSHIFRQPHGRSSPFPTERWVRLRVHLFLSEKSDGIMEIWQDDIKVIDARGQTLPTAKTVYDRLEVGITANGSTAQEHTLYMDDVTISNRAFW